eukprot:181942_1
MSMTEDSSCSSIAKCKSLQNLSQILHFYETTQKNKDNDIFEIEKLMVQYMQSNKYQHLISDFHHILLDHLNEENSAKNATNYERVNNICAKYISCDIITCQCYTRNGRNRENDDLKQDSANKQHDQYGQIIIDMLDNIHTYFIHGFDTGFRIKSDALKYKIDANNNDIKSDDKEIFQLHIDQQMKTLSNHIQTKREYLVKQRGLDRIDNNKFLTNIPQEEKDEQKHDINDIQQVKEIEYSFGQMYYYWNFYKNNKDIDTDGNKGYKYCDWYIKTKYKNMKVD